MLVANELNNVCRTMFYKVFYNPIKQLNVVIITYVVYICNEIKKW